MPRVTVKEQERERSAARTRDAYRTLHRTGIYGSVLRKMNKAIWGFQNAGLITPRRWWWSTVLEASCCGDGFHQRGLGNWSGFRERWVYLKTVRWKICSSLNEIWDWGGASLNNRTATLSVLTKLHPNVFDWPCQRSWESDARRIYIHIHIYI